MTIEAMWKSLVTDVRNWSNVTVGRARGTIDEETHLKIVTGVAVPLDLLKSFFQVPVRRSSTLD